MPSTDVLHFSDKTVNNYRLATDTATIDEKYNDTPALNASQHWAAPQKVGRVRTLWRPLNQWHSQILPLRREVVSNRRILIK